MKMSKGDARALASKIRKAVHEDMMGRKGIGNAFEEVDEEILEEIHKTHTDIIAKVIERYFA